MSNPIKDLGTEFTDVNLTVRDRMNYAYILGNQWLTIQRIMATPDMGEQLLQAVEAFSKQLPNAWKDEDYIKDLKKAETEIVKDIREDVVPGIKPSVELCKELGLPFEETIIQRNPWSVLQAIVNLLSRMGMLSRRNYTEIRTGDEWDKEWELPVEQP